MTSNLSSWFSSFSDFEETLHWFNNIRMWHHTCIFRKAFQIKLRKINKCFRKIDVKTLRTTKLFWSNSSAAILYSKNHRLNVIFMIKRSLTYHSSFILGQVNSFVFSTRRYLPSILSPLWSITFFSDECNLCCAESLKEINEIIHKKSKNNWKIDFIFFLLIKKYKTLFSSKSKKKFKN